MPGHLLTSSSQVSCAHSAPVLLDDSKGIAIETGMPASAVAGQTKVTAI